MQQNPLGRVAAALWNHSQSIIPLWWRQWRPLRRWTSVPCGRCYSPERISLFAASLFGYWGHGFEFNSGSERKSKFFCVVLFCVGVCEGFVILNHSMIMDVIREWWRRRGGGIVRFSIRHTSDERYGTEEGSSCNTSDQCSTLFRLICSRLEMSVQWTEIAGRNLYLMICEVLAEVNMSILVFWTVNVSVDYTVSIFRAKP